VKVTIDIDCTPQEARVFMGLPDMSPLNDHLVEEMRKRMETNINALQPDELMRSWFANAQGAQEQFMKLMTGAASGSK
jgi:hypothetical protein